jgi:hypothetical protein
MSKQFSKIALGLFLIAGGLWLPLQAQKLPQLNWNMGYVVLNNQDTLQGNLSFERQADYVYFRNEAGFRIFHWQNLRYFEFFDQQLNLKRYFVKYTTSKTQNFLLERIVQGRFTLVKEIRKLYSSWNNCYAEYFDPINRYWIWDGKKLVAIRKFKKQIRTFARENHLKLNPISSANRHFWHIQWLNSLNRELSELPFQISSR